MSNEDQSTENVDGKKNLNLNSLLMAKTSIKTSVGILYVRYRCLEDLKYFDLEDDVELGRVVIQRLCSRIEDKQDISALDDDDLKLLSDNDFRELAQAIAIQNKWRELPDKLELKDLGDIVKEDLRVRTERHQKMLGSLQKSINSSYSFLGKGVLDNLQKQMADIANIRSSLSTTGYARTALQNVILPRVSDHIKLAEASSLHKPIIPPRFEQTPLGRATVENVENLRQVAEKVDNLVVVVAGLNQTLIQDVLPAWFNKIQEDQGAAKTAFEQAAHGLWVTKWAVIISVIVTIAATWWQVSVAWNIDLESSEQQRRAEHILKEQLLAQHRLIEQQTKDAAAIRALIARLKQPTPIANLRE